MHIMSYNINAILLQSVLFLAQFIFNVYICARSEIIRQYLMEKQKFQIETDFKRIPVGILWSYISTPAGLHEWFADEVTLQGKVFTFTWEDGTEQKANILSLRNDMLIRLRWTDDTTRNYFEMRILTNEITESTSLLITDFATPDELDELRELWTLQLDSLRTLLGC